MNSSRILHKRLTSSISFRRQAIIIFLTMMTIHYSLIPLCTVNAWVGQDDEGMPYHRTHSRHQQGHKRQRQNTFQEDSSFKKNDWIDRLRDAMGIEDDDNSMEDKTENSSSFIFIIDLLREYSDKIVQKVMNTKPSKSLLHGIFAASMNVMRGYYNGVQILIAYPFASWKSDNNWDEVAKDSLVGLLSGGLMVASGVVTGCYQIILGIESIYSGAKARMNGMVWNDDECNWSFYSLEDDLVDLQRSVASYEAMIDSAVYMDSETHEPQLRKRSFRKVRDKTYYNLLKVPTDASSSEIKRSYYFLALSTHPDKNPDDKDAASKFQELSNAYQTLSNDQTREAYDLHGTCFQDMQDTTNMMSEIDPYTFFALMFGSYNVEPYVGQLSIASTVDSLFQIAKDQTKINSLRERNKAQSALVQRKRQVEIALNLLNRIELFDDDSASSIEAFVASCREEAKVISQGEFGDIFLTYIGHVMLSEANQYLGYQTFLGVKGQALNVYNRGSRMAKKFSTTWLLAKTLRLGIKTYLEARDAFPSTSDETTEEVDNFFSEFSSQSQDNESCQNDGESKEETTYEDILSRIKSSELLLPTMLELVWEVNIQDITNTLSKSCNKLLDDASTSKERKRRAKALKVLGEEFFAQGTKQEERSFPNLNQMKERVEFALLESITMNDDIVKTRRQQKKRRAAS